MDTKPAPKKPTVRASHRSAVETFLDSQEGTFRRSGLWKALYPLTTPRSRQVAEHLADVLIRELAKAGRIQRHGHLHWIKVSKERKLLSGRAVPELDETARLPTLTRCPKKWVLIDLETGGVSIGTATGWSKASAVERKEAAAVLG